MGEFFEKIKENKKLLYSLIAIIAIIVIWIVLTIISSIQQGKRLKVYVDELAPESYLVSQDMIQIKDNKIYLSIERMAVLRGFGYNGGEYGSVNEDKEVCYIESATDAVVYYENESQISIVKTGEESTWSYEDISAPVIRINGSLYAPIDAIKYGIGSEVMYTQKNNTLQIYTPIMLVTKYLPTLQAKGCNKINQDGDNTKTFVYGLIVGEKSVEKKTRMGVTDLKGETVIGFKYDKVKFSPTMQEFYVTLDEKIGVIAKDGTTILAPKYKEIKLLDKELGLRIVKAEEKYGVVKKDGSVLLFEEYTSIGVDTTLYADDQKDIQNLIYDKNIIICKDEKWGMYDIKGNVVLPITYDGIGYVSKNSSNKANNVLLVKSQEGIIVKKGEKFGIVDKDGKVIVDAAFDSILVQKSGDKEVCYLQNGTEKLELEAYLKAQKQQANNAQ